MSDEEEDYMSDKFLTNLTDVRPSLINNRAKKREIEVENKRKGSIKRQRDEQNDNDFKARLLEGLNRHIEPDNKGFQLLSKMGYKPGTALGKDGQENNNAIKEPVAISLKADRAGLGRDAALQELAKKRAEIQRKHLLRKAGITDMESVSLEAYRKRFAQKAEERKLEFDLKRCQRICADLDQKANVFEPELKFFWPVPITPPDEKDIADMTEGNKECALEEEEEEIYSNVEKLELLTGYLRTAFKFCYWCGVSYDNEADLTANCPGTTYDDH